MKPAVKVSRMTQKYYKAIITEKTAPTFGKCFANTKNGQYKNLSYADFMEAIKFSQAFSFEIIEF